MMQNTLFRPSVVRDARANFNPEGFDLAAVLKARQAGEEVDGDNTFKDLVGLGIPLQMDFIKRDFF